MPLPRVAAAALLLAACRPSPPAPPAPVTADTMAVRRDIAYLASPELEGRLTGTPGNDSAAVFIARRFAALGLEPAFAAESARGSGPARRSYVQRFPIAPLVAHRLDLGTRVVTQNVAAILPGSDPALRGEYVVLGAHYDHVGRWQLAARDGFKPASVRVGADDNASGTAAVMELARRLVERPPRRSVLFVAFSGEEQWLKGSEYFVEHPPVPLHTVVAMLNFDMVGRLRGERLQISGVSSARELRAIVDSAAVPPLRVSAVGNGWTPPSDHRSFLWRKIPALHFFTGMHHDYHTGTDLPERINAAGLIRVVELGERVARAIADRPERLSRR